MGALIARVRELVGGHTDRTEERELVDCWPGVARPTCPECGGGGPR